MIAMPALIPALREVRITRFVFSSVGWVNDSQSIGKHNRCLGDIPRIQLQVRIAIWMDIPFGAIERQRNVKQFDMCRHIEKSDLTRLHTGVTGLPEQERQPGDFQIGTRAYDEIRSANLGNQARTRLDMVRILLTTDRRIDPQQIAPQLSRQFCPFRFAGEDPQVSHRNGCI
jgi:hypothetical protein